MKIMKYLAILATALSTILVQADAHPAPSILPDGSFEKLDPRTNQPVGWPGGRSLSWVVEDGNRFARLTSSGTAHMDSLFIEAPLPQGVRALELTYRARVTGLERGEQPYHDARIIINFKDAEGKRIGSPRPAYFRSSTDGWVDRKLAFLVPEGTASLDFMPSLFHTQSGTFDLDNIALRPVDPRPLEEERARNAPPPVPPLEEPNPASWPEELFVDGNRLVDQHGNEVWLQGVNVASLEWRVDGENVLSSVVVAIEDWNANVIRLPVKDDYWFGTTPGQNDNGKAYRDLVDAAITLATNRGAYVVLDLHRYRAPRDEYLDFWRDAATRYKNHPGVLFDLINEPHGISWEVWRNGGFVKERGSADEDAFFDSEEERIANLKGFQSPGMQRMVDVVRETGARNILVIGALDYAYDLSGILQGYAIDDYEGNGIMYSSHIYPWKRGWQKAMLDVAEFYPILIGEVGAPSRVQPWQNERDFIKPEDWYPDMLGLIQKYRLNWTGWCFHPQAGPRMIQDWRYTPTPNWGEPAKRALAGEQFELKRIW